MTKFRAFLWSSILGGGLLIASGSALASGSHGHNGVSYHKHRPQLVRTYRNHRGKGFGSLRPLRNHPAGKDYNVRGHRRHYWVKRHRHFPRRFWKRYHYRGYWGHGPVRRPPHTVIIEREEEVESETSSIRIGPEELSVIIPLPW